MTEPVHYASADGHRLVYYRFGPKDGAPTVLCHGLAAGATQFFADAERLAAGGRCVIVPDVRGHGASRGDIAPVPANFTIDLMSEDVVRMLAHAGLGPIDWLGNSLGGILALALAPRRPELFRTIAMFGTAPALNLPRFAATSLPFGYRVMGRNWIAYWTARVTTPNPTGRAIIRKLIHDFDPHVGAAISENVRRYDLIEAAIALTIPMLIIRGSADRAVNMALDKAFPRLMTNPNIARLDLVGAGHCANLDKPDELYAALAAFWDRA
jgi:3-oxoadipate enol-lactonase